MLEKKGFPMGRAPQWLRCFLGFILLIFVLSPVFAAGGTNGILGRMEQMVHELADINVLSPKEVKTWEERIKTLRKKVEARIEENGGGINTSRDKDLYDEIDQYNKPLFELYQQHKAKPVAY